MSISDIRVLDKIMKPYWDSLFDNAELRDKEIVGEPWVGFYVGDKLIFGCPSSDPYNTWNVWYYDGNYFQSGRHIFSIDDVSDFRNAMKRYITKKYGFKISDIL